MRVEKMGSKSDMFVKLVLVFFISLLSFAIGTFVGKKYSDNQHKLALLEPGSKDHDTHSRGVASESAHEEEVASDGPKKGDHANAKSEKGVALTDAEIAKLAEEFVQDEEPPVAIEKGHGATEHGTVEHDNSRTTASVPAKNAEKESHDKNEHEKTAVAAKNEKLDKIVEKMKTTAAHDGTKTTTTVKKESEKENAGHAKATTGHAPVKAQKASEKVSEIAEQVAKEKILNEKVQTNTKAAPTSLPKEVVNASVGKFTVQIASHTDEMDAKRLAEELKKKGYAAFYVPANIKGQTYYRVSVGMFSTQKEAQDYRAELVEKANVGSAFVQKIIQ